MKISKKIVIVVLVTILVLLFAWVGSAAYSGWQGYKWQKQTDAFQESLKRPYKEDTYGGKTPEETWAMFLDALKKGDVELASKYFVVERQGEMKDKFAGILEKKLLDNTMKNFSTFEVEKGIQADSAYYHIRMPFSQSKTGYILSPVIFTLNSYTKIWKISVL